MTNALQNRIIGEGLEAPDQLLANPGNWRVHPKEQQAALEGVLKQVGWVQRVIVNKVTGHIVDGHLRVSVALKRGEPTVPVIYVELTPDEEKVILATIDPIAGLAGTDQAMLDELLDGVTTGDADLDAFLDSLRSGDDEEGEGSDAPAGSLAEKFMIPPFTVLNAREGWWQDRKRAWLALGMKSELGRNDGLTFSGAAKSFDHYRAKNGANVKNEKQGTSIFDPVLCELSYRWYCPPGGLILDCFAGGSVRGIVASKTGRQYIGHELRQEQVDANRAQGSELCADDDHPPAWICGDSRNIDSTCKDVQADFLFSCPPYADLEVYSDDPKDLSTLGYEGFRDAYFEIIRKSCDRLKNDRFACFVVGDVRDKKGNYYDFVGDTVQAFRDAGLHYYNEAILVTAVGGLPIRAGKQFAASRKLGKTHQNVLVFVKGDGKKAAQACGEVNVDDALAGAAPEEVSP